MKKTLVLIGLSAPLFLAACGSGSSTPQAPTVGHLYLVSPVNSTIYNYSVGNDDALTLATTQAFPSSAYGFAIATDPTAQYAILADNTTGLLYAYTIGANGVLSTAPTATSSSPANTYPLALTFDSTGQYVYVANAGGGNNSISEFSVGTNGALSLITTLALAGTNPNAIVANPKAPYVYVVSGSSIITTYSIGSNGTLSPAAVSSVAAEGASGLVIDQSGQYAYAATSAGILEYSIQSNGGLTPISTPVALTGNAPYSIAIDPTNAFLYVKNTGTTNILVYSIGVNGVLSPLPDLVAPQTDIPSFAMTSHL
jgi:6-phosphogluconolactonase (cycloisomerase 2 family)